MPKLAPYKFEVIAICQVLDDDGNIISEQPVGRQTQDGLAPVVVFGVDALEKWAREFPDALEQAEPGD